MFNFGSLFSGIGDFIQGQQTAEGYEASEEGFKEAARLTLLSGRIKDNAMRRAAFQLKGQTTAAVGGSGLGLSGSSLDVIRSNTQQLGLTKAITDLNTKLEYNSYMAQAAQAKATKKASSTGGLFGAIGGILGFFSDDELKEDMTLIGRRGDGIGIYEFRYRGSPTRYRGVRASEIEVLRPDAIVIDGEYRRVDYAVLQIPFEKVTDAASASIQ